MNLDIGRREQETPRTAYEKQNDRMENLCASEYYETVVNRFNPSRPSHR